MQEYGRIARLLALLLLATSLPAGATADNELSPTVIHTSDEMGWAATTIHLAPGQSIIQIVASSTAPAYGATVLAFDANGTEIRAMSTDRINAATRVYIHTDDTHTEISDPYTESTSGFALSAHIQFGSETVGDGLQVTILAYGLSPTDINWRLEIFADNPPTIGEVLRADGGIYRTLRDFEEGTHAGISADVELASVAVGAQTTFDIEHRFYGSIAARWLHAYAAETTLTRGDTTEKCPCHFYAGGGDPGTYVVRRTGFEAPTANTAILIRGVDARLPDQPPWRHDSA